MGPVRNVVVLGVPVRAAFDTFTLRIDAWWPVSHRTLPASTLRFDGSGVGARLVERAPDGRERAFGEVLTWEPPVSLAFTWTLGVPAPPVGAPGLTTRVDVVFVAEGPARTRVEVVHSEGTSALGAAWPQRAVRFDDGWKHALAALAAWERPAG